MVVDSVHSATQRHHQEVSILPSLGSLASRCCPIPRTASLKDHKTVAKLPGLTVILSNLQRQKGQCYVSISSKEGFPETLQQTSLKCNGESCVRGQCPNQSMAPKWVKPTGMPLLAETHAGRVRVEAWTDQSSYRGAGAGGCLQQPPLWEGLTTCTIILKNYSQTQPSDDSTSTFQI